MGFDFQLFAVVFVQLHLERQRLFVSDELLHMDSLTLHLAPQRCACVHLSECVCVCVCAQVRFLALSGVLELAKTQLELKQLIFLFIFNVLTLLISTHTNDGKIKVPFVTVLLLTRGILGNILLLFVRKWTLILRTDM